MKNILYYFAKMGLKTKLLISLGMFLFIVIFFLLSDRSLQLVPEKLWVPVEQGDLPVVKIHSGEIRAVTAIDIKAPMEWRMELQIIDMIPEASFVKKGDFLLSFDPSALQQQLEMAQDRLQIAIAEKDKLVTLQDSRMTLLLDDQKTAEYSRDIAELQLELYKFESANKQQDAALAYKKALVQLEESAIAIESEKIIARAQLNTAQLRIQEEQTNVNELEQKIKNMTITAPHGGMVVYREIGRNDRHKVMIGDKPHPGATVLSIPDLGSMQVYALINEMDAIYLQPGQPVDISLDAYPEIKFTGQVYEVAQLAQKDRHDTNVKEFQVLIRIDQTDNLLKPGMTARAEVTLDTFRDKTFLPLSAIFEKDGKSIVFPEKSFPEPLPVEILETTDRFAILNPENVADVKQVAAVSPDPDVQRLGFLSYRQLTVERESFYADAFDELESRGMQYDYQGRRDRKVIADFDSNAVPIDMEALRAKIESMQQAGKTLELDPKIMKELNRTLQGRDTTKMIVE